MTRLTRRDGIATLLVAAVLVGYLGYLANGSVLFVGTVSGIAAVGLVFGLAACVVGGWRFHREAPTVNPLRATLGIVTATAGLTAVVTESPWLLALFMVGTVALWALTTRAHALPNGSAAGTRPGGEPGSPDREKSAPVLRRW